MQPAEVHAALESYHLLDVREQDEWEAGHIEGAQHIPLGELGLRVAELPRDRTIVCVCKMGGRSARAQQSLLRLGFNAENLEGGVTAWTEAGLALITERGTPGRVL